MTAIAFDTLAITKRLKAKGFSEAQAEAITEEIQISHDVNLEQLATKGDIKDVRAEILLMKADIHSTIKDMQLKLGAMIVGLGAFLAAIKFLG